MADDFVPVLNPASMKKLGEKLQKEFGTYEKDRKDLELQWLINLRQFRGIYDPTIDKQIPDDQSTAYPKITRNKVIGTVARLMEMLFPRTDKNYAVTNSPIPNLSEADLQTVLNTLVQETNGADLSTDQIEKAIVSLAKEKAKKLDLIITDQLTELDYVALARAVVRSAVLHGPGCLKGPMVEQESARIWTKNAQGQYVASTITRNKPYFELVSCWDIYTDLSAKTLDATDAEYQRHIMARTQVEALAERADFLPDQVKEYLRTHVKGNWKEKHWETALRARNSDKSNVTDLSGRKYEAIEFWGRVTGKDLKGCGCNVPDARLTDEIECNVWMIEDFIIKAVLSPYDEKIRGYHWFIYEDDEINLLGNGVPVVVRDSQMAICEAARMVLDNGSVVCGPMLEVNESLLKPGQDLDVYARKIWIRESEDLTAQFPAVREIRVDSHIAELISVIDLFMGFADAETALPPPALGDVSGQGKESLRTTGNLSMLLGAAALPIRDTVRNFDKFTVSVISSLIAWNREFNMGPATDGDATVIATGSSSLIAKEVRATALDQFMTTLTPDERIYLSTKKTLLERMRVRDLPDDLMEEDDVVKSKLAEQARNAQLMGQQQSALLGAQIKSEVAGAFKDLMLGLKAQAGASADTFTAIVEGIINERASQQPAGPGGGSGASPKAAQPSRRTGVAGAS